MRLVTIVSLGASAVLGLGALVVAKVALPHSASAKVAAEPPGAPLVVANRAIKYGDKLDAAMLTVIRVPAAAAPEGAYSSVAQVLTADHGGAPVALTPIAPREALLPTKISGPGARPTIAAEISEGMRAYTIKVTDVTGVGGHALPGDRVDVVLMRDQTPEGQVRNFVSYVVIQNVRVLGIDLNADLASSKPASPNTATLEVTPEDAQKLSIASSAGFLSLSLRRTGAGELAPLTPIRVADFLGGPAAPRVAASGPVRRSAPRSAGAPSMGSGIVIVEGEGIKRNRRAATKLSDLPAASPNNTPAATGDRNAAAAS